VCLAASHRFAYLLNLASLRTPLHPFFESVLSLVKQVAHLCRRWSSFEPSCHLLHLTQLSRVNHPTHANLQCRREELSRSVHLLIVLAKRRREEWVHGWSHRTLGSLTHFIELLLSSFIKFSRYEISHQHPSDFELWLWARYIIALHSRSRELVFYTTYCLDWRARNLCYHDGLCQSLSMRTILASVIMIGHSICNRLVVDRSWELFDGSCWLEYIGDS
jgi:hypothetical protein